MTSFEMPGLIGPAYRLRLFMACLLVAALFGCAPAPTTHEGADEAAEPESVPAADAALQFLTSREVRLPQFAGGGSEPLFILWTEPDAEGGNNLLLARRAEDGRYATPVQVNDIDGTAGGGSLDEGRPAIAFGSEGVVAVAWTARGGDIRAAVSRDGGGSFAPSLPLNSDAGTRAYRGFVDVAVDDAGVAHAAWIDGRFAPRGAEEPAELFYARVEGDQVTERNLTADQEASICGCCRIDVTARPGGGLVMAFRNTGGGFRDIFRIEAGPDGEFGEPARLGPPMWELSGCPVIGPLNVGEATLWSEASTGKRRILAATDTDGGYEVVLEDTDEWAIERPPRRVVGAGAGDTLLLVPGRLAGKLLRGGGTAWSVVADDIPRWAMSAAVIDGTLVAIGALDGVLQVAARPAEF